MRFQVLISLSLLISVSQAAPVSSDHDATSENKPFSSVVTSSVVLSLGVQTQFSSVTPFETTVPATQQTGLDSINEPSVIRSDASVPTQATTSSTGSADSGTPPLAQPTGSTTPAASTPPSADTSAINSGNIEASPTPIASSPPSAHSGDASAVGEPQSAARSQTSHLVLPSSVTISSIEAPSSSSGTALPTVSESVSIIEDLICGGRCKPCRSLFGIKFC